MRGVEYTRNVVYQHYMLDVTITAAVIAYTASTNSCYWTLRAEISNVT